MNSKQTLSAAAALFASVALIAGAVAPASAATNDPAKKQEASSQESSGAKVDKKRYCLEDTFTGSRISKRKCLTRAEWIQQTGQDPVQAQ